MMKNISATVKLKLNRKDNEKKAMCKNKQVKGLRKAGIAPPLSFVLYVQGLCTETQINSITSPRQ
jgi:hypothetical protein